MSILPEEDGPILKPEFATKFRRVVARANIQYAVKEAARGMAAPRKSNYEKLVRIAKYLVERKRCVVKYGYQKQAYGINCFGDFDFAGQLKTRKGASGGMMCLGDHAVKTWSSTQSVLALSTGEAELNAINETAATGKRGQSILNYVGVQLDLRVFTDATTSKSLMSRRGLGKVRHIAVNELWLQSHVYSKSVTIVKIKNKLNPSDTMTKYQTKADTQQIVEHMQHSHEEGRPEAAPQLTRTSDESSEEKGELHSINPCKAQSDEQGDECAGDDDATIVGNTSSGIEAHTIPANRLT